MINEFTEEVLVINNLNKWPGLFFRNDEGLAQFNPRSPAFTLFEAKTCNPISKKFIQFI